MSDVEWIGHLSRVRNDTPLPSRQMIEVMSWRVATTLLRRHPSRLRLVETHPGGGTYDCLSLYHREDHSLGDLHLNRGGSATVFRKFDGSSEPGHMGQWRTIWGEAAVVEDLRHVVEGLERLCGLPHIDNLPPSTPEVLGFRFVSAFLTANAFSSEKWECRMGCADTSGPLGGGVRGDLFDPFPMLKERLGVRTSDDFLQEPAYRFWFLLLEDEPLLGFEAGTASAVSRDGKQYNLKDLYRASNRLLWPVIWEVAGDLLP